MTRGRAGCLRLVLRVVAGRSEPAWRAASISVSITIAVGSPRRRFSARVATEGAPTGGEVRAEATGRGPRAARRRLRHADPGRVHEGRAPRCGCSPPGRRAAASPIAGRGAAPCPA